MPCGGFPGENFVFRSGRLGLRLVDVSRFTAPWFPVTRVTPCFCLAEKDVFSASKKGAIKHKLR